MAETLFLLIVLPFVFVLVCVMIEPTFFRIPWDLRDPDWGSLEDFNALMDKVKPGITVRDALQLLEGKPVAVPEKAQLVCVWKSQPFGVFKDSVQKRYVFQFNSSGALTEVSVDDGPEESGMRFYNVIFH